MNESHINRNSCLPMYSQVKVYESLWLEWKTHGVKTH